MHSTGANLGACIYAGNSSIAGTAAITAADVAVTVSATAGLASSVIGITGQVYGKLAGDAAAAGNKAGASKYGDISYALGWTSFALGMASTAVGVGLEVSGAIGAKTAAEAARTATRETTINLSQAANKLNKNYLADIYDIGIRKSSQFKVTKQIMGYTGDITWAAGKGFGEASRNEAKSGDNEKSEIYGKIATGIFWISLGAGYFSVGMSTMKTPFAFKETSDKLFPQAAE